MKKQRVIIIGAGIAGLACAHRIGERSRALGLEIEPILLEASKRPGGIIETALSDGCVLEQGPDSFISEKPWALDLCRRLGIENEIISTQANNRESFILRNGSLVRVPKGFYLTAPVKLFPFLFSGIIGFRGKLRMACELFIPKKKIQGDESVASFIRRRFGTEALAKIAQPMIGGIYSGDLEKLSLESTFPKFLEMEARYGSVIRGLKAQAASQAGAQATSGPRYGLFLSFKQGIETLVAAILRELPPNSLRCEARVSTVEKKETWEVTTTEGEVLHADALCIATPAFEAARLIGELNPEASTLLNQIPYKSLATVNLLFQKTDLDGCFQKGFGFVVPDEEKRSILGCSYSSMKYEGRAPDEKILLRAFVPAGTDATLINLSDDELSTLIISELQDILNFKASPERITIKRYVRGMPQYQVGHQQLIREAEKLVFKCENLFLTGNSYAGVGIPDCIRHAEAQADRIIEFITNRAKIL